MNLTKFKELPLMGILRAIEPQALEPLLETVISVGLKTIEITMNTKDACKLIKRAGKISKNRLCIGAGTVLDKQSLHFALGAGATFIVMPVFIADVVKYCVKHKVPVFPGAFSPQEIYNAWNNGATMVKVFPAKFFGPQYFKEIKGPFAEIALLACAGITPQNLRSYFSNGANAVAFGASVFKKEWLDKKDFQSIGQLIKKYVQAFECL